MDNVKLISGIRRQEMFLYNSSLVLLRLNSKKEREFIVHTPAVVPVILLKILGGKASVLV